LKRDETLGGIAIFIFGGVAVILSLRMPLGTFRMAGTGLFPFCLGILLMILSISFLLKIFFQTRKEAEKKERRAEIPGSSRQLILFFGTMVLATLLFNAFGYPLVSFLLMLALLRILGMKRWGLNIVISGVTAAASYFLFVQWLQIPLPKGWIGLG
jgi:putative tricarboxylic transport membrane protein